MLGPSLINLGNMRGRLMRWLADRHESRLLKRFGGIQTCCWCRQVAQLGDSWYFEHWEEDLMLDKLTCGVCGGTSLYKFAIGMVYMGPLDPPAPAWPASEYLEARLAKGRVKECAGGPDAP